MLAACAATMFTFASDPHLQGAATLADFVCPALAHAHTHRRYARRCSIAGGARARCRAHVLRVALLAVSSLWRSVVRCLCTLAPSEGSVPRPSLTQPRTAHRAVPQLSFAIIGGLFLYTNYLARGLGDEVAWRAVSMAARADALRAGAVVVKVESPKHADEDREELVSSSR
jgi:hypothetical protein